MINGKKHKISKEKLEELYLSQNKTCKEVSEYFGIAPRSLREYIKIWNLHKPKFSITKDELTELYITQNLSSIQIGNLKNISPTVVQKKLRDYNIEKSLSYDIPEEELRHFYLKENYTIPQLANYYNVNYMTISRRIKKFKLFKSGKLRGARIKKSNQERYGVNSTTQLKEIKKAQEKTLEKHYGVRVPAKNSEIQRKGQLTKQKNGTCNTSKPEEELYTFLKKKYGSKQVKRQYNTQLIEKSDRYPFNCDFYIKSLDLFIEYQGNWTHGTEPFDISNSEHKKRYLFLKSHSKNSTYYADTLKTWTQTDPLKREVAKKNKLNFIELWSLIDVILLDSIPSKLEI